MFERRQTVIPKAQFGYDQFLIDKCTVFSAALWLALEATGHGIESQPIDVSIDNFLATFMGSNPHHFELKIIYLLHDQKLNGPCHL